MYSIRYALQGACILLSIRINGTLLIVEWHDVIVSHVINIEDVLNDRIIRVRETHIMAANLNLTLRFILQYCSCCNAVTT